MTSEVATTAFGIPQPKDETSNTLSRWSKRWKDSMLGWHKSDLHHFLKKYGTTIIPNFESTETCTEDGVRVFFPLCGKTVDMGVLAEEESISEVVGIDGVTKALLEFSDENPDLQIKKAENVGPVETFVGKKITLLRGDFFDIDAVATGGKFDSIFDRASLVAISPDLREKYVDVIGKLIKPGGKILLVTFDRRVGTDEAKAAGPPYSVNEDTVRKLYEGQDWVERVTMLEELDELANDPSSKQRWLSQGLSSLYELCFIIEAKKK